MDGTVSSPYTSRITLLDQKMVKDLLLSDSHLLHGRNVNRPFGENCVEAEIVADSTLWGAGDQDLESRSKQHAESASLFFGGKRNLADHSVAAKDVVTSSYEEFFESLAELEAKTIGNLLPDDDDLLSGVTDGFAHHTNGEETEELDLFSNVGGLELGEDGSLQRSIELSEARRVKSHGTFGELSMVEHPSRTLFVRNTDSNVDDSDLTELFEQYGDISTLYTACKHRGFIMISYYDIRAACNAMKALRSKALRSRKLDIHFSVPKESPLGEDINQGILAIHVGSSVSNDELHESFSLYGEVMEIRDTPVGSSHHKFVEFYDVRAAASALRNFGSEIGGKKIKLEPVGPADCKRLMQLHYSQQETGESDSMLPQHSPLSNLTAAFSGSLLLGSISSCTEIGTMLSLQSTEGGSVSHLVDDGATSCVSISSPLCPRTEPRKHSSMSDYGHIRNHSTCEIQGPTNFQAHSFPDYDHSLSNGLWLGSPGNFSSWPSEIIYGQQLNSFVLDAQPVESRKAFGFSASGSCRPPLHHMWNHLHGPRPICPSSPSFICGISAISLRQMHGPPGSPLILDSGLPLRNIHVGSAPSFNGSAWDQHHAYSRESPDANVFHPGSLGSGNSPRPNEFVPRNSLPRAGANRMDMSTPTKNFGMHPHHHFPPRNQTFPIFSAHESLNERTRSRRNEANLSQADKKQFELDIDRIMQGEDRRTTLMIKNIPNKYTSKMLLATIDERHKGTYDFIYLPIDFKNKCNVGYAFINMTEPSLIVPFHKTFHGKKWEKFNSEKVASLAYARIQGKPALIAHFQNSSLMNEDKRCRPILFHTDGPNAGDQVPFPVGPNIRARPGKHVRTEENGKEERAACVVGDEFCSGDSSSSGSGRDSD